MQFLRGAVDIFFHLDVHLAAWAAVMGPWLYGLLFVIIFCETGLVVTPFLPGDSLLFAVGALAAVEGSPVNLLSVIIILIIAAAAGDSVNYEIGKHIGPKIFYSEKSRWLNKKHLIQAHNFYEKYGGKTIIFARFIPIIRTFAPFVAGIGKMTYGRFLVYNVTGGVAWVLLFTLAGYKFANIPAVKTHFHYVILGIIVISLLPAIWEFARAKMQKTK